MQDIILNLLQSMLKFSPYFQYFWDVKVKPKFSISSVVIMDFDVQPRSSSSPKDLLRIQRDKKNLTVTKNKMMETISIDDEAHTPSNDDTMDFLEDFNRVDDISHDDYEDDSSNLETDYNGYEQDYAYAEDNRVTISLNYLKWLTATKAVTVTKKTW